MAMKIIKLKHSKNIRDIGGVYHNVTLKEGMLIRGRTLTGLDEGDIKILTQDNHVRTIIDLRSQKEQKEEGEMDIPGVKHLAMPVFESEEKEAPHEKRDKKHSLDYLNYLPKMEQVYADFLHGESLENVGKIIHKIITAKDEEYGFYFHCSEGKDRTGVIAAILLLMLGVEKKGIYKDYLETNRTNNRKAFKYYMLFKYVKFKPLFALKAGRAFVARKRYLNVLFNIIKDEYGDEETFYTKGLHLSKDEIEAFRKKMIIR